MNWKQFLTEKVLKEPEATSEYTVANNGDLVSVKTVIKNRTFNNRNDLMDLYEAIYKSDKWLEYTLYILSYHGMIASPWIFCLDGKDYEDRCKMVVDFYGWEEEG